MIKKVLVSVFSSAILFSIGAISVNAQTNCQPIYGGGQTCVQEGDIQIDKKVKNPSSNEFVENLSSNDPKFNTSNIVEFQIKVTNTSDNIVENITVKDIFPRFLDYQKGTGDFDKNTKTLTFKIDSLSANETKSYAITADVAGNIPNGTTCVVNLAQATQNGNTSSDNSQVCLEKQEGTTPPTTTPPSTTKGGQQVFPPTNVSKSPSTGPEMFALFALIPAAGAGFFLRKKAIAN